MRRLENRSVGVDGILPGAPRPRQGRVLRPRSWRMLVLFPLLGFQAACSAEVCQGPECREGVLLMFEEPLVVGSSMLIELWLDDVFVECVLPDAESSRCDDVGVEVDGDDVISALYVRDRAPTRVEISIVKGGDRYMEATVWPYYLLESPCPGEECLSGYGWL